MTDTNKKILLTLLGIIILFAAYMYVVKPKMSSIKSLESDIDELQARYDDLCAKEAQKEQLLAETEEFNKQFDEVVEKFAPDLNQENTVEFLKNTELENDFVNMSVALPQETAYYIIGQGAVAGQEQVADADNDAYVVYNDNYNISYSGTYEGVKSYLDYILNYKYRMAVEQITIAFAEDADAPITECTGSLTLNTYAVKHEDRIADIPKVDVEEGKENIFATEGEYMSTSAGSSDHDSDNGDSIVSNHNMIIMLNNAGNDTSSGIIAAASASNEATYVTSNENKVEDLTISITEEDGKNYITYAIGSKSYKAEVLTSDVAIYVKSSSRVDDKDTNGVNVKISNDTALPVYIKVADDDASNPRFKLAEKAGSVKQY
ncbi:MAG: hypothetical protein J5929_05520 [Eubacterium sp.]|nr:hypothetical protein [Eubacterium sp.]